MRIHFKAIWLILISLVIISSGCSASFEQELDESIAAVEKAFNEPAENTNKENKDIEYYIPFGFEVEEESKSNIILKNGSKTYILFYNLQESASSNVVLKASLKQKEYDVNKQFESKDKLGYLLIDKNAETENEVTLGVGGVKVTSEVKTKSLKSETEAMMRIANSVKYKN